MLEWTVLLFLSYSCAYSYAYYLHTSIPLVTRNILLHETGTTGASKRSKRNDVVVTFGGVQFQDPLSSSLRRLNIAESPSPIQEVAISPLSNGESYFLHAPTGTGKTFAYLLPVLKQLYGMKKRKALSALIIVPSKELASQVMLNRIASIIIDNTLMCNKGSFRCGTINKFGYFHVYITQFS